MTRARALGARPRPRWSGRRRAAARPRRPRRPGRGLRTSVARPGAARSRRASSCSAISFRASPATGAIRARHSRSASHRRLRARPIARAAERSDAVVAAVRPGAVAGDLDALARGTARLPAHTGHGLGTAWHEEPRIVPGSATVLEAGHGRRVRARDYGDGGRARRAGGARDGRTAARCSPATSSSLLTVACSEPPRRGR